MGSRVADVMKSNVTTVAPCAPIGDLIALMNTHRCSCLIVEEGGRPVGVISERDIVRLAADWVRSGAILAGTARDIMTSPVITIDADCAIPTAIQTMKDRRIRRLPVVDREGTLVGLITQGDLVGAYSRALEQQTHLLEAEVAKRTAELAAANEKLAALSLTDELLQVGNRRAMAASLHQSHQLFQRYGGSYSVLLVDVDHFKLYNDHYGHPRADVVLQRVAAALRESLRSVDGIFRFGGEEILILLPRTPASGAMCLATRLVTKIAGLGITHDKSPFKRVTVSIGVATSGESDAAADDVVSRADVGLYEAKSGGRNAAVAASVVPIATARAS